MFTTKITPSASFAGSFDLEVYWDSGKPCASIPCHNYASAETLARRITQPPVNEGLIEEDRTGLIAEIIPGRFYGSYTVLVFDENNLLCNAIPCANIGTARHYQARPTRHSL